MTISSNDTTAVPVIHVLKIDTCPSISQASQLTFHLGHEAGNPQHIYLRLVANSGPGKIHPGWLALSDIEKALSAVPAESPFKASVLAPLFRGRSTNNLHFSVAVLLHCGLLKKGEDTAEGYVRNVPDALWKELTALITAGTDLAVPAMGPSAGTKEVAPAKSAKGSKKVAAPATT